MPPNLAAPIGILDSGVGGLSVLLEIQRELPAENLLYFADSGNCPYGPRPPDQIRQLAERVAAFLLEQGAKALVVACNTASTASVAYLRQKWPDMPIVGMVPAVKPAALSTKSGVIGVLATAATSRAPVLLDVIDRFATNARVLVTAPPGLVELIEEGQTDTPTTRAILSDCLKPLLEQQADTLVLGCTHFPFLKPALTDLTHGQMQLIDSGQAVARQTRRVLTAAELLNPADRPGTLTAFTSGNVEQGRKVMSSLLGLADQYALDLTNVTLV